MRGLKRLLANKNVVTIIGAILIVAILYGFYTWRVNQATNPIKVPYAKVMINARTEITSEMIGYVDVPQSALKGNVLTNVKDKILGKYTNVNCVIPAGSYFYKDAVVSFSELPDSFLVNIPEGLVAYNFSVNTESTYGNSVYPGNYIDIYYKGVEGGQIVVGKLIENIKVLAVKDSNGNHVFENTGENRNPSQIIFAVTEEINTLLRKAKYINQSELILVPTNVSYVNESEDQIITSITSDSIKSIIESK